MIYEWRFMILGSCLALGGGVRSRALEAQKPGGADLLGMKLSPNNFEIRIAAMPVETQIRCHPKTSLLTCRPSSDLTNNRIQRRRAVNGWSRKAMETCVCC